jgi:RHS repeat-associated protein
LGTTTGVKTGFTGHEHDTELGLINMNGRLYDPMLHRFTAGDPFVADLFNGQGLNRYAYVKNNPMRLVDPSGFGDEAPKPPDWATTGNNDQEKVLRWNMWQHKLAQEMGLEKGPQKAEAPKPAAAEGTGDESGDADTGPGGEGKGSGDQGANVTGGNGTPRSGANTPTGETGGPPSDYFRAYHQGQYSRGGEGPTGGGRGEGSGSSPEWIAARVAGGFVPFVGPFLTMQDPGASAEEKGWALIEILGDAATLGMVTPVKGLIKGADKGVDALRAADKIRDAKKAGTNANGQAIDELGQVLGPSGRPAYHNRSHGGNRHRATRAAQDRSAKGAKAMVHDNPKRGDPHAHATKKQGGKDFKKNDQRHEDF